MTSKGWTGLSGFNIAFNSVDDPVLKHEITGDSPLWKFTLVTEDAGGKRVIDFMGRADAPPPNPQTVFPVGTKVYYPQVTSIQEFLVSDWQRSFIAKETELLDHWFCQPGGELKRQIRYKLNSGGLLEVYIVEGDPSCADPTAEQANTISYGSWSRVNKQGFDGFELVFPADKPYGFEFAFLDSKPYGAYQGVIDTTVFEKSGRLYILKAGTSSLSYRFAITMPAGTVIKSRQAFFDKNALPLLKKTLGLE